MMKKFYCNGKKDFCSNNNFCSFAGVEELPNCHLSNCNFFDGSGGELIETDKEAENESGVIANVHDN